jgi:hypothetical protein
MHPVLPCLLMLSLLSVGATPLHAETSLSTVAERSGFVKTGRYDEVVALCGAYARQYPNAVRCLEFALNTRLVLEQPSP